MGKIVIMARDPSTDGDPQWAAQYVAKAPAKRGTVSVPPSTNWISFAPLVTRAAAVAGQDGTVAFLGGHGRACAATDPMCNQNPQLNFSIELCTPNIVLEQDILFYKTSKPPSTSLEKNDKGTLESVKTNPSLIQAATAARLRLQKRQAYDDIGAALRLNKVRWVLMLACRCSIGMPLITQLAADWGVIVGVYNQRLAIGRNGAKIRLYFDGDAPGTGSNMANAETELPDFAEPHGIAVHPNGATQTFVN